MAINIQGTLDPTSHDFAVTATFSFPGPNNTTIDRPFTLQIPGYRYDLFVTQLTAMLDPNVRVGGPSSTIGPGDVARTLAKFYEVLNAPQPVPTLQTFIAPDV